MLRTLLCDLLGIEYPIIQASIGPWSSVELAAAVSNAGGLGSLGTALLSAAKLQSQLAQIRELTERPFVVNHTARPFNEELFALTLAARSAIRASWSSARTPPASSSSSRFTACGRRARRPSAAWM